MLGIRGPNLSRRIASLRESRDAFEASDRVASELTSAIGARPGIIQKKKEEDEAFASVAD